MILTGFETCSVSAKSEAPVHLVGSDAPCLGKQLWPSGLPRQQKSRLPVQALWHLFRQECMFDSGSSQPVFSRLSSGELDEHVTYAEAPMEKPDEPHGKLSHVATRSLSVLSPDWPRPRSIGHCPRQAQDAQSKPATGSASDTGAGAQTSGYARSLYTLNARQARGSHLKWKVVPTAHEPHRKTRTSATVGPRVGIPRARARNCHFCAEARRVGVSTLAKS